MELLVLVLIVAVLVYIFNKSRQNKLSSDMVTDDLAKFEDKELLNLALIIRRYFYYFPQNKFKLRGASSAPPDFLTVLDRFVDDKESSKNSDCVRFKRIYNESYGVYQDSDIPLGDISDIPLEVTSQHGAKPQTLPLTAVQSIMAIFTYFVDGEMATDSLGRTTTDVVGLPVPLLTPVLRREHFYVVGKIGSGKTTFLERLIFLDLQQSRPVIVMSPEANWFSDSILPMLPANTDLERVIYFAPAHPDNNLTFNPLEIEAGDDPTRVAEDIFTTMRRALGDADMGPRMKPIMQNALSAVMARPNSTFWDVKRFLEDRGFRDETLERVSDEYITDFWTTTFLNFPKDAVQPVVNRLDQFLRPPVMRRAFCQPRSSFSISSILNDGKIFLLDMAGLSEESRLIVGQLILSKFQLALMSRERRGGEYKEVYLYADEFQSFGHTGLSTWRQLLSRGRKYGLCLILANQYPSQLPTELLNEILGNVSSLVAFSLRSKDASVINKEMMTQATHPDTDPDEIVPVEVFLNLQKGSAMMKFDRSPAIRVQVTQNTIQNPQSGPEIMKRLYQMEADRAPDAISTTKRTTQPTKPADEDSDDDPSSWLG